jgi:uncharacterized protein YjdB
MKQKFFTSIRTLLLGAALPLLGAVALTSAPKLASAQPIDPERILYYIDFATIPTATTWLASEGDHFGGSGAANRVENMDGVLIGTSSKTTRLRSSRVATNNNGNNLDPAPSVGFLMFVTRTTGTTQANAPYVTLPTVREPVNEIVAYIRAGSSGTYNAVFELLDPAADTVLEHSGATTLATNGQPSVRISYTPTATYDSVKVKVKMICTESGKNGYISDIWILSAPLPPTGISVTSSEPRIALGSTCELTAKVEKYPYADQTTVWSLQTAADSAKASIVSSGTATATLTGIAEGTVTVVATSVNGLTATATVEVAQIPDATSITITPEDTTKTLAVGATYKLTTATLPALALQRATWEVLDAGILSLTPDPNSVNVATVTGLAVGSARVVAKAVTDGITDTITLKVEVINLDSVAIIGSKTLYVNGSFKFSTQTFPAKAGNHSVTWVSSNPSVVAVNDTGLVSSVALGAATITATAADGGGAFGSLDVRVTNIYVDSLNAPNATVGKRITSSGGGGFTTGFDRKDALVEYDSLFFANASASSGRRGVVYFFDVPVPFATKAVVEFDWQVGTYGGADSDEGQLSFRSGEAKEDDIFTLYVRGRERNSSKNINFAVGVIDGFNGSDYNTRKVEATGSVATENRVSFSDAPTGGAWYHVKVNLYPGQRATVELTSHNDTIFNGERYTASAIIPAPAGWSPTSISNIFVNMTRGSNITWNTKLDNLSIRIADNDVAILPTGISLASQHPIIGTGGATNEFTATVAPIDVSNAAVTWSLRDAADSAAATIAVNPSNFLKATLTSGAVEATVGVIATTVNGISDTLITEIGEVLVDSIAISGDTLVTVNNSITLSKATFPDNAGNSSVTWSSSNVSIATVDAATGEVTGVSAGYVTITATAADAGHVTATYTVKVEFRNVSKVALHGARRVFHTADPASMAQFTVTTSVSPSVASVKTVTWSSTNEAVVEVVDGSSGSSAVVKLTGHGKAAVKATTTDGSGVVGYYYVEVAQDNPYDKFSDLETELDVFHLTPITGYANGTTTTYETFHGTKAMKTVPASTSGGRNYAAVLKQPVVGDVVKVRFDWYIDCNTDGIISIRADSVGDKNSFGRDKIGSANDDVGGGAGVYIAEKNIISVRFSKSEKLFKYFTDGYTHPASNTIGESGWPEGDTLHKITNFDTWYTFDLTVDYFRKVVRSFTVAERDLPENTATVENIPLDSLLTTDAAKMRTVKAIFVVGQRPGSGSISFTSAFDNFAQKVLVSSYELVDVTFDPDGGAFADGATEAKTVKVIANTAFEEFIPQVTRSNHNLVGWYQGSTAYTPEYTTATPVTLTAKWQIDQYTVTFNSDGGSAVASQTVDHGGKASEPADPTRTGHNFIGWYNGTTPWNFGTATVIANVTLTARWETSGEEGPTGVDDNALSGIALYPNPASGSATLSGLEGGEVVDVINLNGTLLLSRKAAGDKETIDLTSLPQGAYIVRVAKAGAAKRIKLVVK